MQDARKSHNEELARRSATSGSGGASSSGRKLLSLADVDPQSALAPGSSNAPSNVCHPHLLPACLRLTSLVLDSQTAVRSKAVAVDGSLRMLHPHLLSPKPLLTEPTLVQCRALDEASCVIAPHALLWKPMLTLP